MTCQKLLQEYWQARAKTTDEENDIENQNEQAQTLQAAPVDEEAEDRVRQASQPRSRSGRIRRRPKKLRD